MKLQSDCKLKPRKKNSEIRNKTLSDLLDNILRSVDT
jgi:hypothetical protein